MTTVNDQHYINQIIEGNSKAFEVLVDRYKNFVFTLAHKMMKDREEAEEVAQDTFIKVYRSINKYKGEAKFSTWVYKITYNTCLDRLKKRKEKNVVYIEDFSETELRAIGNTLDNIDEKDRNQKIQDCLHLLLSEEAFLLTLYYFDGQSIEEISKVMDTNANNIKIKLFRTRKKITSLLKERLEPEIIEYYASRRR